ncbi:GMC family oxidoreductase [Corallococcus praedator]|uniref:Cholesterol oxidase n=1 Tax=Corallococcus praedator TaxID=2316724 RepID=A0ABX9QK32_9BACT|nr:MULTISPECIES: GMC family oxidoreductase [Corallococcus]RKH32783.1 GMC family oxidoreductase [Corallococcus sp. CA031C]RKI10528.1 GMC family oxidoreductase [Corallococcus praedator]
MAPAYDALVIGTGFGGAVAACRLAQAGLSVRVLERGLRYPKGSFPRDFEDPTNGWLWQHRQGLFDIKLLKGMSIVQSAGYGGGSLIYANVHLRPPAEVFSSGWPEGYSREALDPYYDLVAHMLDVQPITTSARGLPTKTKRMQEVAKKLGREAQFFHPNLAVRFAPAGEPMRNKFGVMQEGCNYCGECDIGCNVRAKNTLDLNYLAVAEQQGAEVSTQAEVTRIEPLSPGYRVTYTDHAAAGMQRTVDARRVFLCAGAVNTTELLLRNRDVLGTLPDVSARLGTRYSANGDFLAFAFDTKEAWDPAVGPTITTGMVVEEGTGKDKTWFLFQEGGHPVQAAGLMLAMDPDRALSLPADLLQRELVKVLRARSKEMASIENERGRFQAVFLAMGRDKANGRLSLSPVTRELQVQWDVPANLPLYRTQEQLCEDVARALGTRAAYNPLWERLHLPVSVHNLGGCAMAEEPAYGVLDPEGQVHGYPGLYVFDGAALPVGIGVNPSSSIAAVAERNVERAIRKVKNAPGWVAPERGPAQPVRADPSASARVGMRMMPVVETAHTPVVPGTDPLGTVVIPPGGTVASPTPVVGLRFTERMKGHLHPGHVPADDYAGAARAGQRSGDVAEFVVTITLPNLDRFLAQESHGGIAQGTLHVKGLTPPGGAAVENGVFNLFVDTERFYERRMLYLLPFTGVDGQPYLLDGYKEVCDNAGFDVWSDTSTLYTVVRRGHERSGTVVSSGIIRLHLPDFIQQVTTFSVLGTSSPLKQADAMRRFGGMFMGTLWDVFARAKFD